MSRLLRWLRLATALGLGGAVLVTVILLPGARERISGEFILPPGREAQVQALLGPLFTEGFLDWPCGAVQLHQQEVRIQLGEARPVGEGEDGGCAGVPWARAPGGLTLRWRPGTAWRPGEGPLSGEHRSGGLALAWHLCHEPAPRPAPSALEEATGLLPAMLGHRPETIWREANRPTEAGWNAGLISGLANLLGLPPGTSLAVALGFGLLLAGLAGVFIGRRWRRLRGARATSKLEAPTGASAGGRALVALVVLGLVIAGTLLRFSTAATYPWDGDEVWAVGTTDTPLLNRDHDAWVHPPLYRVGVQVWSRSLGWQEGDSLLALRLPSVLSLVLALLALGLVALGQRGPPAALVFLAVLALAPGLMEEGGLARPYALATGLFTLGLVAIWPVGSARSRESTGLDVGLAAFLGILALGLAAWTDLLTGATGCALVGLRFLTAPRSSALGGKGGLALTLALALFCAPLLPAGLAAAAGQVRPEEIRQGLAEAPPTADDFVPDLSPRLGDGRPGPSLSAGGLLSQAFFARWPASLPATAAGLLLLGLLLHLTLLRRRWLGLGLPLLLLLFLQVGLVVGLRARNLLFFPHLAVLTALWLLRPGRPASPPDPAAPRPSPELPMPERLASSLTLPCGQVLKNRLLKSAMSEGLGRLDFLPDERLARLYARWAAGGTGVLVTGNVMIDRRALGEPGNVVLEEGAALETFAAWAEAASSGDTKVWMQLNHPGKQAVPYFNRESVAPSALGFGGALKKAFPVPRAMEAEEIRAGIERFATAAALAEEAGFHGAQIHGAHGYLVSQFLSPLHNQREDEWGGSLENRMRFPLEIYRAMRARVSADFAVSIKLNSADFQRGGFSEAEALEVVARLGEEGIDLIEISGGTYEAPAMTGPRKASTEAREAYFLDFAGKARGATDAPLALTGGFRTAAVMEEALGSGAIDLVGLARPLALDPDASRKLLAGEASTPVPTQIGTGLRGLDTMLMFAITYYEAQLWRMGAGKDPEPGLSPWRVAAGLLGANGMKALRRRRV